MLTAAIRLNSALLKKTLKVLLQVKMKSGQNFMQKAKELQEKKVLKMLQILFIM